MLSRCFHTRLFAHKHSSYNLKDWILFIPFVDVVVVVIVALYVVFYYCCCYGREWHIILNVLIQRSSLFPPYWRIILFTRGKYWNIQHSNVKIQKEQRIFWFWLWLWVSCECMHAIRRKRLILMLILWQESWCHFNRPNGSLIFLFFLDFLCEIYSKYCAQMSCVSLINCKSYAAILMNQLPFEIFCVCVCMCVWAYVWQLSVFKWNPAMNDMNIRSRKF